MSANNINVSIDQHDCSAEKCIFNTKLIDLDALQKYNTQAAAINDEKYASKKDVLDNELVISSALNDLNTRLIEVKDEVTENVEITSSTLNDLSSRLEDLEETASAAVNDGKYAFKQDVLDNELVISSALNDLNTRLIEVEDNVGTGTSLSNFGVINAGGVDINADIKSDKFTIASGENIDITPDASTNKITISSVDTKYYPGIGLNVSDNGTTFKVNLKDENSIGEVGGKIYPIGVDSTGNLAVSVPWEDHNDDTNTAHTHRSGTGLSITGSGGIDGEVVYNLKPAAADELGGFETGYPQNDKNYPVELSGNKAYVSVPWEDHNDDTTYTFNGGLDGFSVTPSTGSEQFVPISISRKTLTIQTNGVDKGSFTGAADTNINITASDLGLSAALKYKGITDTGLTDGASTNPIIIDGLEHTAEAGWVVFFGDKEFVYNGAKWEELGYPSSIVLNTVNTGNNSVSEVVAAQGHTHATNEAGNHTHDFTAVGAVGLAGSESNGVLTITAGFYGTTASTAAAGNHSHNVASTTTAGTTVAANTHTHSVTPTGSIV